MDRTDHLDELDRLFGPAAVMDLDQRGLLPSSVGRDRPVTPDAADRIAGALMGAAIGNALGLATRHLSPDEIRERHGTVRGFVGRSGRQRVRGGDLGAEGRLLVSWAGDLASESRSAAPSLAETLARPSYRLRSPGQAIVETRERLDQGVPWYAAAPDSFGNGALLRAVADGARWVGDPKWRPRSAVLGCLVTHAHPRAVAASVALAELVAAGIADPDALADPIALAHDLAEWVEDPVVAAALRVLPDAGPNRSLAHESLAQGVACFARYRSPDVALLAAVNAGGAADVVAGVVGALFGAREGAGAFPLEWRDGVEHRDRILRRADRLRRAQDLPASRRPARRRVAPDGGGAGAGGAEPVHLWYLIDRSGSMAPLHDAVVDGFNAFLADQQAAPGTARLTLVQFDGRNPYEVLVNGARVERVAPLTPAQYQPRSSTPLYDALGSLIDAAEARIADRARRGKAEEDQLVVVFTDGLENASTRWDRREIFARIDEKKADGWTFVYLGANQDSYAVGAGLGVAPGSVADWAPTVDGHLSAVGAASAAAVAYRAKARPARRADHDGYFLGFEKPEAAPTGR